ncbi:hypothetical protein M0805_005666 [Coniferiporia weirii]|nr:hypothetical protein M0805_005666 [Coniferiporia weirii]
MTGPDRTPHSRDARFHPLAHIILDPRTASSGSAASNADGGKKAPRPQNAWILYRQWALSRLLDANPELKGTPQSQLSKRLAEQWKDESSDVRQHFEHMANVSKEQHALEHPNYSFKPVKKVVKQREREAKKQAKARAKEAEKLAKELEKALRAGRLPASVPGTADDASAGTQALAGADSDIHKVALHHFSDLGPSPPMSECPSRASSPYQSSDESPDDEPAASSAGNTPPLGGGVSKEVTAVRGVSSDSTGAGSDASPQSVAPFLPSNATEWESDTTVAQDASRASSSATADSATNWGDSFGQTNVGANSLVNGWMASLSSRGQSLVAGQSAFSSSGLTLPSDSQIFGGGMQFHRDNRFVGIQVDTSTDLLADQFECDFTNPYQEQGPTNSLLLDITPPTQQESGAIFTQSFSAPNLSLSDLLAIGENVDGVLMDEIEARGYDARVIAAEHVQNGVPPAMAPENYPGSSFLPSPPESAPAISPAAGPNFGFDKIMQPTNLAASGSSRQAPDGLGFEDIMPAPDMNLSSLGDFVFDDHFGFSNSAMLMDTDSSGFELPALDFANPAMFSLNFAPDDASVISTCRPNDTLLCPNFGAPGSSVQPSMPPTPMSAGFSMDDQFAVIKGQRPDFLMSDSVSPADSADAL